MLRWGEAWSLLSGEESLSQSTFNSLPLKFHLTQRFYKSMGDEELSGAISLVHCWENLPGGLADRDSQQL